MILCFSPKLSLLFQVFCAIYPKLSCFILQVSIIQIASEKMVHILDLIKLFEDVPEVLDSCLTRIFCSSKVLKLGIYSNPHHPHIDDWVFFCMNFDSFLDLEFISFYWIKVTSVLIFLNYNTESLLMWHWLRDGRS